MTGVTRRVWDMCKRVLEWAGAHPDDDPGFIILVGQLQALVARIGVLVAAQRSGQVDAQAASVRKVELQRIILSVYITNLAEIGGLAGREVHELRKTFRFRPSAETYAAFLTAAREMFAQAQAHKEVLAKNGLSESVLTELGRLLDEVDAAVALGHQGRTVHTAATRELAAVTVEARKIVRAMDARNRHRFRDDREALEQWISARAVLGTPRPSPAKEVGAGPHEPAPEAGGEAARPAA